MPRERRIAVRCEVTFEHGGKGFEAIADDLSKRGVFVATTDLLPAGAVSNLQLRLPDGSQVSVVAKVAHRLDVQTAEALGRQAGLGFVFLEHQGEGRSRLSTFLDRLSVEVLSAPAPDVRGAHFVIAHQSLPLRRRIGNVLDQIGCTFILCKDGPQAFDACQDRRPDCLVTQADLPETSGFELVTRLAENFDLVDIPIVLVDSDASPIQRLRGYRLGAADFIPVPFTDEEISIRLRRAVAVGLQAYDAAVLRGRLADIPLPSLLTMFEFERKSGILAIRTPSENGRVFLAEGRILRVELGQSSALEAIYAMLDWPDGEFEFVACPVVVGDEIGLPSSQLVISHAQRADEAVRGR